jgi:hypothetical protein
MENACIKFSADMDVGSVCDKRICLMNSNVNVAEAGLDQSDSIKVLEYPKELTLMSKYMNEIQAKRFKQGHSFQSFFKKGLNLTVLDHELDEPSVRSNIIDSGIRRISSQPVPEAA